MSGVKGAFICLMTVALFHYSLHFIWLWCQATCASEQA